MTVLLESSFRETCKVWAIGSSFTVKDRLKERGYRWSSGYNSEYRAWHKDVDPTQVNAELRFLDDLDPNIGRLVTMQNAYFRFSARLF